MKTFLKFILFSVLFLSLICAASANFGQETLTFDSGSISVKPMWQTVNFNETFLNQPVVFAEINSENGGQAVQPVIRNISPPLLFK